MICDRCGIETAGGEYTEHGVLHDQCVPDREAGRMSLRSKNPVWRQSFLRRWWLKFLWKFPPTRRYMNKKIAKLIPWKELKFSIDFTDDIKCQEDATDA